jgi:hypothetical protein
METKGSGGKEITADGLRGEWPAPNARDEVGAAGDELVQDLECTA